MQYRHFANDTQYDSIIMNGLTAQLGPAYDFNVPAEAFDEGNDDQAFWVMAGLTAFEYGFPDPPSPAPGWLQVAINAFNDYVSRWNTASCNGGLKWQFYQSNAGYDYKSSVANACFFQISARLMRITGNTTYFDWANKIYDWMNGVALIDNLYNVFDGTDDTINCSRVDHDQWSYNVASMLYGSAILSNTTNSSTTWLARTAGFLAATSSFTSPYANATDILFEANCEKAYTCNIDQQSMKAFLVRCLARTSQVAPWTQPRIATILRASALGAANACPEGSILGEVICGTQWWYAPGAYDNQTSYASGLGQQLGAMEIFASLRTNLTSPPGVLPNVTVPIAPPPGVLGMNKTVASATMVHGGKPSSSARPLYQSHATPTSIRGRAEVVGWVGLVVGCNLGVLVGMVW